MAYGLEYRVVLTGSWPDLSPEGVESAVRRAMTRWGELVRSTAQRLAPKDTGVLAGSLMVSIYGTAAEGAIYGQVVSPLKHAPAMEFGRRPGAPPPPRGAMKGWMDRHPPPAWVIEKYPDEDKRADALRWSISIKGIVPHPFLRPAFDVNAGKLAPFIERELFRGGERGKGGQVSVTSHLTTD